MHYIALIAKECNLRGGEGTLHIKLRVVPLAEAICKVLEASSSALEDIRKGVFDEEARESLKKKLSAAASESLTGWKGTWWQRMNADQVFTLRSSICSGDVNLREALGIWTSKGEGESSL